MGFTCIGFALRYRQPILTAWSTSGAALIATNPGQFDMSTAVGAFLFSAALILLAGWTGFFERAMNRLPVALGAAMLAGILLQFSLGVFTSFNTQPLLVGAMLLTWVLSFKRWPRYSVPLVLAAGVSFSYSAGLLSVEAVELTLAMPVWTSPSFDFKALISLGLPLFIVTMASQNIPGVAVLKTSGYEPPVSTVVGWTGLTSLLLAPFGGYCFNLAAITAAICAGEDADPDPKQRYKAVIVAGVFYLLCGLLGATIVTLFALFPQELILSIAGIALFGTVANSLAIATQNPHTREAALLTFLVTFSGISPLGVGAPFWGLLLGGLVLICTRTSKTAH